MNGAQIESMEKVAEEASALLLAMANQKRLMIMCYLLKGERNVNDLAELLGMGQSALSQHLAKLRALKLVATRREKQQIFYRVGSEKIERLLQTLYEIYCAPGQQGAGTAWSAPNG